MPTDPGAMVRVPSGELGPVIGCQADSAHDDGERRVDWDDGSVWFLSRLECGGICAQRWYEPDDVEADNFGPWRDCPVRISASSPAWMASKSPWERRALA